MHSILISIHLLTNDTTNDFKEINDIKTYLFNA